ncbi:aspartate/glutamate racemase family protein [Leucobacter sp. CSA2]|uniref:Aspartate/glutamate racemase family protein n=1 Tax=Leucobacter edaphi TaxID=2796472 RepID=A0A934UYB3_9MICO|nr:aspartate/glutamate racemase family protein [Leucobacter edaphi]MBK0421907.1 aspartate/glutamate racemase family protein [Leucobacter edaphi]
MPTIGFLYPGYGAEDDYPYLQSIVPGDVRLALVHTSVGVDAHEVDALLDLGRSERLLEGAEALRADEPDAIMWACTSGSFVFGLEGARRQAAEVGDALAIPASSTSLAFVDAIQHLGAERVAIAATYPEDVSRHFRKLLQDAGITVVSLVSHDIETAALAGELDDDGVVALAESNNPEEAQIVLLPDTAMHTARIVNRLEEALGKPVLTANQVTLWQGLRLAGIAPVIPQLGALFAKNTTAVTQ